MFAHHIHSVGPVTKRTEFQCYSDPEDSSDDESDEEKEDEYIFYIFRIYYNNEH